jgi:hypothetical protein
LHAASTTSIYHGIKPCEGIKTQELEVSSKPCIDNRYDNAMNETPRYNVFSKQPPFTFFWFNKGLQRYILIRFF